VSDVVLLSLGTTLGWRVSDALFVDQLRSAGVGVEPVAVRVGATRRMRRAYPVTDLVEAAAARRALAAALDRHSPRALVISTTTAAMLADPRGLPYAIRLDAPACLNRPGPQNAGLHALERRALARARLVLPWSEAARAALPAGHAPAIVVPPPIERSDELPWRRDRLAVAYTPDVKAKGLEIVCAAWAAAGIRDASLEVFGVDREPALAHLRRTGVAVPEEVEFRGKTAPEQFRAELRRARVYVGGARWEDFGQAPLEALADGALLATVPAGGPYEGVRLARQLDESLVADRIDPTALAPAIRAAFELPDERVRAYRERAAELLRPYRSEAVQETVERELIPALLG
jgi:hypothetical protein